MPDILVRNLDEALVERLKARPCTRQRPILAGGVNRRTVMKKTRERRRSRHPVSAPVKASLDAGECLEPVPAWDERTWLVAVPLALISIAAFLPVLNNGFVDWDDTGNFLNNPHYRGLGWAQVKWAWTTFWDRPGLLRNLVLHHQDGTSARHHGVLPAARADRLVPRTVPPGHPRDAGLSQPCFSCAGAGRGCLAAWLSYLVILAPNSGLTPRHPHRGLDRLSVVEKQ